MTKHINKIGVTAEGFDLEQFGSLVNDVRRTQKVIASADETRKELEERLAEAQLNLQEALDKNQYDDMQKYTAEAKRISNKLKENPATKVQEFDDAINALVDFFAPREEGQVVEFDRAVGE